MASQEAIDPVRILRRAQRDPVFHLEQVQGISTLEEYQKRICREVAKYERVAISACHDLGKTFTMARLVLWLGSSFPGAKIITTAPTFNQVKRLLWSEIRTGFGKSKYPLGGVMLTTEWKIDDDWFALGFSPQKSAGGGEGQGTSSSFQGFHGGLVVIVFDEATGIPKSIWDQAEGMMTSGHVKFVAIGNPTSRSSPFFSCFKSAAWRKIYLSCFDSPNLIANGVTDMASLIRELDHVRTLSDEERLEHTMRYKVVQPFLLTLKWVVDKALDWGLTHPLFVSKVLGRFPEEDDHTLIPLGLVEEAQRRGESGGDPDRHSIGVDVARFGSDKSVLTHIQGNRAKTPKVLVKRGNTEVAGEVIALIRGIDINPATEITVTVDGTGVGSGVVDILKEKKQEGILPKCVEIREVHFGEGFGEKQIEERKKYVNRKAQMFDRLKDALRENLCLPEDGVYLEELPTIIYRYNSKGQLVIESKDDFKKRTGRSSPDHADSLALATDGLSGRSDVGSIGKVRHGRTHAPSLKAGDRW
jgi:phage terminase large subunit